MKVGIVKEGKFIARSNYKDGLAIGRTKGQLWYFVDGKQTSTVKSISVAFHHTDFYHANKKGEKLSKYKKKYSIAKLYENVGTTKMPKVVDESSFINKLIKGTTKWLVN